MYARTVLPCGGASPGAARRWLAARLQDAGVTDRLDDALLVVSELVGNAVRHAATTVVVELVLDTTDWATGRLRIAVTDGSHRLPRLAPPGLDELGGRGLALVSALGRFGADRHKEGKTVWVELDAGQGSAS